MLALVGDRPETTILGFSKLEVGCFISSPMPRQSKSTPQVTPHLVQTSRLVERANRISSIFFVSHDKLLELSTLLLSDETLRA